MEGTIKAERALDTWRARAASDRPSVRESGSLSRVSSRQVDGRCAPAPPPHSHSLHASAMESHRIEGAHMAAPEVVEPRAAAHDDYSKPKGKPQELTT